MPACLSVCLPACQTAGALVDSDDGEAYDWEEDLEPMLAGVGSLRCATGSLCVSASMTLVSCSAVDSTACRVACRS